MAGSGDLPSEALCYDEGKEREMAEVSLGKYCEEVTDLIKARNYDQAIGICRYILQHYPNYLEAYRLLGQACLQKQDYKEAQTHCQRVLSGDPEDFSARLGLAKVYEAQGNLPEAAWQMERAFELSPGNDIVRQELSRLYEKRDGVAPPRLQLTRAALGRLYARGELYPQAIHDFKAILLEDPDRVDVEIALAEALWASDQKLAAVEVCQNVREKLPNCLKANLILGHVWLYGERNEEAESCLQVARALDPENTVAQQMFRSESPLPPATATIPQMAQIPVAEVPEPVITAPEAEIPLEWLTGLQLEEAVTLEGEREEAVEVPEWLEGVGKEALAALPWETGKEAPVEEVGRLEEVMAEETALPGEGAPIELEEAEGLAAWEQILAEEAPQAAVPAEEIPDWLQQLRPPGAPPAEEVPGWPEELQPEAPVAPAEEAPMGEKAMGRALWEQILAEEGIDLEGIPSLSPAEAAEREEAPDWLKPLEPEGPGVQVPEQPERAGEVPAWLEGAPEEPKPEAEEGLPEWLRKWSGWEATEEEITPPAAAVAPAEKEKTEAEREELPDWLQRLREAPAMPVDMAEEELAEISLAEEEVAEGLGAPAPAVEAPPLEEAGGEIPDWLRQLREGIPEVPAKTEELEAMVTEEGVELEAAPPVVPEEEVPVEALDERAIGRAMWERILAEEGVELEAAPPVVPEEEAVMPLAPEEEAVMPLAPEVAEAPGWLEELVREEFAEEGAEALEMPWMAAPTIAKEEVPPAVVAPPAEEVAPPAKVPVEEAYPPRPVITAAPVEPAKPVSAEEVAPPRKVPSGDYEAQLAEARACRDRGDLAGALKWYEKLVRKGRLLDAIIGDLEALSAAHPSDYLTHQMLGDAYMRGGRLQPALKAYKEAKSKLQISQ
jgi:tetratricopeptide (TPR) repeat protein